MRHSVSYDDRVDQPMTVDPLDAVIAREAPRPLPRVPGRPGRPRSDRARRAICQAFRDILMAEGYDKIRLEHVAARAGVGKATIYRHWSSKQALAHEVLFELANPHLAVPDVGDTRTELLATVLGPMRALTETEFGPVIRALLSEITRDPELGDPFRATVVQARRDEVDRVIARGIRRGDLRPDLQADMATEMLVGPVYFRLMFGGTLDMDFAERVVDEVLQGWSMRGWGEVATSWL
jgi:AcrR family transcriptional regulator